MLKKTKQVFITVYKVSRHCGGSEEGGWWYDWYTPVKSLKIVGGKNAIKKAIRKLQAEYAKGEGERDRFSMAGSPDFVVLKERAQYEYQSTETPYYD